MYYYLTLDWNSSTYYKVSSSNPMKSKDHKKAFASKNIYRLV